MWRRPFGAALAALALLGLAACGNEPVPQDSFYRLSAGETGHRFGQPLLGGTLVVERFNAEGVIAERAILHQEPDSPRLRQYNYHYWTETPGTMIRDAVIAAYRQADAAGRVVSPELRLRPDYRLTGTIKRLNHRLPDTRTGNGRAVIELELSLVRARDGELLLLERYDAFQPTPGPGVPAAATAFRIAVADILARSLDDLAETVTR